MPTNTKKSTHGGTSLLDEEFRVTEGRDEDDQPSTAETTRLTVCLRRLQHGAPKKFNSINVKYVLIGS